MYFYNCTICSIFIFLEWLNEFHFHYILNNDYQKILPKNGFHRRRLFEISRIVVPRFNLVGLCQDFHILYRGAGAVRQYGDNMVMQTTEEKVRRLKFDQNYGHFVYSVHPSCCHILG